MKILTEFENVELAEKASEDFKNKGILTFVSSTNSKILSSYKTGALKVALWVLIDDQYEDALRLLSDPNYAVKTKLSFNEMKLLEEQVDFENLKLNDSFVNKALLIFVITITIMFVSLVSIK